MFGRKSNPEAPAGREVVARRLQQAGLTVAGERGGRAANRVSEALGCGRIDLCNDPNCLDCAPAS
ncbi:hypothetical protein [Streptomyces sp. NPDC058291]|uniref:hypothetical protein n=1 Tax=Streptomyces sp. NPDC058291 TaxID=3346427 RepID=UPI0036E10E25